MRRILYIQYTNPNAYPPLEHGSQILAERGWQVRFIGTRSSGDSNAIKFKEIPNRIVQLTSYCPPGWLQKLHYVRYLVWCWLTVIFRRPQVVYASDGWSYPIAYSLSFVPGLKVVMHEHDSPANTSSFTQRLILWCRKKLVRKALVCICPQASRAENLRRLEPQKLEVVFNCPSTREVISRSNEKTRPSLKLWFHGSIVPSQLPLQVIEAIKQCEFPVFLDFAGYETIGHRGYVSTLIEKAAELGIADRIKYHGAIPTRSEMYQQASSCDVGLVLFSMGFREPMVGASNKPFDYLACGLALLVPSTDEFEEFFVKPGCALSCNSEDVESIAMALKRFATDATLMHGLTGKGHELLASEWNYEHQFLPVVEILENAVSSR